MTKNYYLAINLANNFQSRYPGIGTTTKSGRDPGIRDPGIAIFNYSSLAYLKKHPNVYYL